MYLVCHYNSISPLQNHQKCVYALPHQNSLLTGKFDREVRHWCTSLVL